MSQAQDQNELFDILPEPPAFGIVADPQNLMQANNSGQWPTATRREAHKKGLWHRSIGVWLFTRDGKVALQKRSMMKDTNPGKWQISVAGHVSSGQSVLDAVLAEAQEELGIQLAATDLEFVGAVVRKESGETATFGKHVDNEYKFVFTCMIEEREFEFNTAEVTSVVFQPIQEVFEKFTSRDPSYCPMSPEYISIAYDSIKHKLDSVS